MAFLELNKYFCAVILAIQFNVSSKRVKNEKHQTLFLAYCRGFVEQCRSRTEAASHKRFASVANRYQRRRRVCAIHHC